MYIPVWEVATAQEVYRVQAHARNLRAVSWSRDGRRLATGSVDRKVKIWDAETGEELLTLRGHELKVWSLAWDPEGRRLLSADYELNSVRIWDAGPGYTEER